MGRGRSAQQIAARVGRLAMQKRTMTTGKKKAPMSKAELAAQAHKPEAAAGKEELGRGSKPVFGAGVESKPPGNDPTPAAPSGAASFASAPATGQRITGSLPKPGNAKLAAAAQGAASPGATPPPGAVSDGAGAAAEAPLTVPRPAGSVDAGPAAAAVPGGITGSTATPSTGGAAVQPGGAAMPPGGSGGGAGGGTQLPPAPPQSNRWRLHPALPLDVRALGAGFVALGAAYLYFAQRSQPSQLQSNHANGDGRVEQHSDDFAGEQQLEPSAEIIREQHQADMAPGFADGGQPLAEEEEAPPAAQDEEDVESMDSREARLWEQRQAAAAKPPSDTASVTRNGVGEGTHEETQLPPVDAQPVTDFLNEVLAAPNGQLGGGAEAEPAAEAVARQHGGERLAPPDSGWARDAASDAAAGVKSAGRKAADAASDAAGQVADAASDAAASAKSAAQSAGNKIANAASDAAASAKSAANSAGSRVAEAASDAAASAKSGSRRAANAASDAAGDAADSAGDAAGATRWEAAGPGPAGRPAGSETPVETHVEPAAAEIARQRRGEPFAPPGSGWGRKAATKAADAASETAAKAADAASEAAAQAANAAANAAVQAAAAAKSAGGKVADQAGKVADSTKAAAEMVSHQVADVAGRTGDGARSVGQAVADKAGDAAGSVKFAGQQAADTSKAAGKQTADAAKYAGDQAAHAAKSAGKQAADAVGDAADATKSAGKQAAHATKSVGKQTADAARSAGNRAVGSAKPAGKQAEDTAKSAGDKAAGAAGAAEDPARSAGHKASADNAADVAKSSADDASDTRGGAWEHVTDPKGSANSSGGNGKAHGWAGAAPGSRKQAAAGWGDLEAPFIEDIIEDKPLDDDGGTASEGERPAPPGAAPSDAEFAGNTEADDNDLDDEAEAAAMRAALSRGDDGGSGGGVLGRVAGILGLAEDLDPPALVRKAVDRDEGMDWDDYHARLKQAAADARSFEEALEQAQRFHEGELQQREGQIAAQARHAQDLLGVIHEQAEERREAESEARAAADRQLRAELERQEAELQRRAAEETNEERTARSQQLDSLRVRLGALGRAFSRRSDEARTSHEAHKLTLAVLGLQDALAQGRPFQAALEDLALGGEKDPIVRAALAALPQQLADQGLPTSAQLASRFANVSRAVRQLSYVPEGGAGLATIGVAKLASLLKVQEPLVSDVSPETVDGALSQVAADLAAHRLQVAADTLERAAAGSAAAGAASEWVAAARARASADQTLRLLQAHATALTSSLS